ncbi:MAG: class I SAM-dependent methyltransferase [Devosia sp.]|jgi:SAM-dependent methyltransferase|nr:class I SAM-dependent methyltransferase [Devosiaceae bacterium]
MNSLAPDIAAEKSYDELRLGWLVEAVQQNRFIPAPDPQSIFVGDGDFRAIGAEFLGHLVRIGGLEPRDRVLDIGCGIGRIAAPLTQYLLPTASYLGLDPAREGIDWCRGAITSVYPNFRFRHLDVAHPLYNPEGLLRGETLVLPLGNGSVDFALLVSVVTHLPPDEIATYAREIARVLAPGGTCFLTCFSIDPGGPPATVADPRCAFARLGDGPAWSGNPTDPLAMMAYDAGWIEARLSDAGLAPAPLRPGSWRGIRAPHYQDVLVAKKPGRR